MVDPRRPNHFLILDNKMEQGQPYKLPFHSLSMADSAIWAKKDVALVPYHALDGDLSGIWCFTWQFDGIVPFFESVEGHDL